MTNDQFPAAVLEWESPSVAKKQVSKQDQALLCRLLRLCLTRPCSVAHGHVIHTKSRQHRYAMSNTWANTVGKAYQTTSEHIAGMLAHTHTHTQTAALSHGCWKQQRLSHLGGLPVAPSGTSSSGTAWQKVTTPVPLSSPSPTFPTAV